MSDKYSSCIFKNKKSDEFINWLVEVLAPVLMGSKPSELISLPKYDSELTNKINIIEEYIGKCNRIEYKIYVYKNNSIKVFFYNPIALNNCLMEKRNLRFLKSLGYPREYSLYNYLRFLVNRIKNNFIPDEIGIFLGYPLKDIIGFMGHPSLKLTKVNGWRVYGDPRLSDMKFKEFIEAKLKIRNLLNQYTPEKVLFSI